MVFFYDFFVYPNTEETESAEDMNTKKSNKKPENRKSIEEKNQDENITKQTEEMDSCHYRYCGLFNLTKLSINGPI
jgi:hypothetical protein